MLSIGVRGNDSRRDLPSAPATVMSECSTAGSNRDSTKSSDTLLAHSSLANSSDWLSNGSEPFLKDWAFLVNLLGVRCHPF